MFPPMKKTFQDDEKNEWTVDITVATLKRVKSLCDFSFDSIIKTPKSRDDIEEATAPLTEFLDDSVRFSEVLYAILKPAADAKNLTHEQFDNGFHGGSLDDAQNAFLQALHDFFQQAPKRMAVRGLMEMRKRMAQANAIKQKRMEAMIAEMTPEKVAEMVNRELDAALSKSATESPETSASTPVLTA